MCFVCFCCRYKRVSDNNKISQMLKIYGQIESLKKIRLTLNERDVTEFNSIKDINHFISAYHNNIKNLRDSANRQITKDIGILKSKISDLEELKCKRIEIINNEIDERLYNLKNRINIIETKTDISFLQKVRHSFIQFSTRRKIRKNELRRIVKIKKARKKLNSELGSLKSKLNNYTSNIENIAKQRIEPKLERISHIKNVIEEINPLIAGAIGEYKVVKELDNLAICGSLINDFNLTFNPPIYNKSENDRIHSVQIDHLLVTHSGLFILETKNWSKKSIANYNLRSPIAQINRSSYALYRFLHNTNSLFLESHHWGKKKIPIRNLIVMINNKPNQDFKYVKITTLKELNGYIGHFDSVLSDNEVMNITEFLLQNQQYTKTNFKTQSRYIYKDIPEKLRNTKTINDLYKERWL